VLGGMSASVNTGKGRYWYMGDGPCLDWETMWGKGEKAILWEKRKVEIHESATELEEEVSAGG